MADLIRKAKTPMEHSDHILAAAPGSWLLACEPVEGVNMRAGGVLRYEIGARFRVEFGSGGLLWCLDEQARSVTFDREQMFALERAHG